MLRFSRAVLTAAALFAAAPAFAILPQQGMWSLGAEANGKPGRGIQIDRQGGETLIITYFGYRPDGSATFLQASGKLIDGREFAGDLIEYKNGRAMGGASRDGEVSHVAGSVSISFDSATSGTITLPGEAPQGFSRYQFEDHLARLNHRHEYRRFLWNSRHFSESTSTIRASAAQFSMDETSVGDKCQYTGDLRATGDSFASKGAVVCTRASPDLGGPNRYELFDLKIDERGMLSGQLHLYKTVNGIRPEGESVFIFHLQGTCASDGPEFADGSKSRCRSAELNIGPLSPTDQLPPAAIPAR